VDKDNISSTPNTQHPSPKGFYWEAFKTFFKIGAFTLGGGYAMISIIQNEVVVKRKWIPEDQFVDLIAVAQSCPGVLAANISVFVGYKMRKAPGALVTCLGAILPSFLIILAIAMFFHAFQENKTVAAMFAGLACVSLGTGLFKGNLQVLVGNLYDNPKYSRIIIQVFKINP